MIVCLQCGKMLADDVRFCDSCGFAILDDEQAENAADFAATPFAAGSQTASSHAGCESGAREVPNSFWGAVMLCFRRGGPRGRSSRAEFWIWILFLFLTVFCPAVLSVVSALAKDVFSDFDAAVFIFALVWALICSIPTLTLAVRRFHDANISGTPLYALFSLIVVCPVVLYYREGGYFGFWESPLTGFFFFTAKTCLLGVLVVALAPGTKGENRYGPPPVKRKTTAKDKTQNDEVAQ